jgi:hypothetical protein
MTTTPWLQSTTRPTTAHIAERRQVWAQTERVRFFRSGAALGSAAGSSRLATFKPRPAETF